MTTQPARPRTILRDISSRAWEHPADRGALVALRRFKGFDAVLKAVSGLFSEPRTGRGCPPPRTRRRRFACT